MGSPSVCTTWVTCLCVMVSSMPRCILCHDPAPTFWFVTCYRLAISSSLFLCTFCLCSHRLCMFVFLIIWLVDFGFRYGQWMLDCGIWNWMKHLCEDFGLLLLCDAVVTGLWTWSAVIVYWIERGLFSGMCFWITDIRP